ncbi:hypothetical protein V5799_010051 [Amblyomma americanum]|uniref:TRAF1-6 MATH domain-containing protein n=1 Tax=Amblyomma americanum TaxID=6943 RepID=A0AAQ4FA28_AMBAM
MKSIPRNSELGKTLCVFSVKDVKSLQQAAMKTCRASYEGELVYLRGYHLSPGVTFINYGGCLKLHARLRLYKGNMDDVLQWPFQHRIKLGVVHPIGTSDLVIEASDDPSSKFLQRPTACSNPAGYFTATSVDIGGLITGGYVQNDELRVMLELLPRTAIK